jgi:hypothetical protein
MWQEAADNELSTRQAMTHMIRNNNLAGSCALLDLGVDVEVFLPDFDITSLDREHFLDWVWDHDKHFTRRSANRTSPCRRRWARHACQIPPRDLAGISYGDQ